MANEYCHRCQRVTETVIAQNGDDDSFTWEECSVCFTERKPPQQHASSEEQHGRYIDCGPGAWDDRD